jgi:septal ring factor EnvC (AmiA/AmiB activator)
VTEPQEQSEVLRLRACRDNLERIRKDLDRAREQRAKLEQTIDNLLQEERDAIQERRAAIEAADRAAPKIPRLRIAKEAGMNRGNLHKLLEEITKGGS